MSRPRIAAFVSLLLFLITGKLKATSPAPVPPAQAAGYSIVFYDDFTNLNLSPDDTGQYAWYPGIWWYKPLPNPLHASVSSSVLDLDWISGQSRSDTTISGCSSDGARCRTFRYGYFEARMKWDVTTGAWPAFWLLPVENAWGATEYGELDVFEGQGDPTNAHTFFGTIHDWMVVNGTAMDMQNNKAKNSSVISGVDFSQWHTYGLLWVPGRVIWYFDNQPIITSITFPIFDQQDFFIVLASQEGANWTPGNISGVTANSLNLYVDWVKVWQLTQPPKGIVSLPL